MTEALLKKLWLVAAFALFMAPCYFMVVGSFQTTAGAMKMPPPLYPSNPTFDNYTRLERLPIGSMALNSLVVVIGTAVGSIGLSILGGYAFAFYQFPLKRVAWSALMIGMMIPRIALIIPQYVICKDLGIAGTLAAVILPCIYSPFGLYMARTFFESIPPALLEAARMDGASEGRIIARIVAPVSAPVVAALAVFAAVGALQDYIWQMLVLQIPERQTLLVGLMRAAMERGGGDLNVNIIGRALAVGNILLLPLLGVFFAANKYFVSTLDGAVKE